MRASHRLVILAAAVAVAISLFALPAMAFADDEAAVQVEPEADAAIAQEAVEEADEDMVAQAAPYRNKYPSLQAAMDAFVADGRWAPGTPWDDDDTPKLDSDNYNGGCAAYASDFGYFVSGMDSFDWPEYENASEIQAGDTIRVELSGGLDHSIVVLGRWGSTLETIEGNYDSTVTRTTSRYSVYGNTLYEYGRPCTFWWGNRIPNYYGYDLNLAQISLPHGTNVQNKAGGWEYIPSDYAGYEAKNTAPVSITFMGTKLNQGVDYKVTGYKLANLQITDYRSSYGYVLYQGDQVAQIVGLGSFAGQSIVAQERCGWDADEDDAYIDTRKLGTVGRLAGNNALDTMQKVVEAGKFKAGGTVVLANAWGYHDALTAAGVAGLEGAPVVMTDGKALSAQAKSLLQSLKPARIVVCGGTGAVSDKVVADAKKAAGAKTVERAAGSNAAGTAVDIYRKGSGWAKTAIVATSGTYHDALAAAPLSYAAHLPIFMTEWTGALSSATIKAMQAGGIEQAYIAGGTYWIPDSTAQQLEKAGIKVVKRLAGDTAVETSSAIAAEAIAKYKMKADNLGAATTSSHYDALAGAAFCGAKKSVMLLVNDEYSSSILDFMWKRYNSINRAYVFGGNGSVSDATFAMIKNAVS